MSDEVFEQSVRKFLKQLGVTANQEIVKALAGQTGQARKVQAVITLEGTDLRHVVEASICLPEADG